MQRIRISGFSFIVFLWSESILSSLCRYQNLKKNFIYNAANEEYIIFRGVLIISCYDKESGIKSCFGWKIYFCFLCHDNMTGLLSTLYITKMTSPSSDYQYGKIWTCERYQHDQTSNRYGKIIKVGKIWAWEGSHGVIYWYIDR